MATIHLITDGYSLRKAGKLVWAIEQALIGANGKISHVQLREQIDEEHSANDEEVVEIAKQLIPICRKHEAKLIINRKPELAKLAGADGVQLGQGSVSLGDAQNILGQGAEIGYSAHSVEEARKACESGHSYVYLSPIFFSLSKRHGTRTPHGVQALKDARPLVSCPLVALSGITSENIAECIMSGADGAGVIFAILHADDPKEAASILASKIQ